MASRAKRGAEMELRARVGDTTGQTLPLGQEAAPFSDVFVLANSVSVAASRWTNAEGLEMAAAQNSEKVGGVSTAGE